MNDLFFRHFYLEKMRGVLEMVLSTNDSGEVVARQLESSDAKALFALINSQEIKDLQYFRPHNFDLESIKKQFRKKSFLMMGVFDNNKIVGYFFLRFFANKKCFVGRLISKESRGKGFGSIMNRIMYETAWTLDFRCLSTISRNNVAVVQAHLKNDSVHVLKELRDDYLLVEFVPVDNQPDHSEFNNRRLDDYLK